MKPVVAASTGKKNTKNNNRLERAARLSRATSLALEPMEKRVLMTASVLADWNFSGLSNAVNTAPAVTSGANSTSAAASSIGMTYNSNTDASVIEANSGNNGYGTGSSPTGASPAKEWKIVGTGSSSGNGWNYNAPIGSQGAQFLVSTVGYNNVSLTFDWGVSSAKANGQLAVEYTLNGGTTWNPAPAGSLSLGANTNYTGTLTGKGSTVVESAGLAAIGSSTGIINGPYFQDQTNINPGTAGADAGDYQNGLTANFSSVTGAANNPNFGVRLVNAAAGSAYALSAAGTGLPSQTSGNWRFDNVSISGTSASVPVVGTQPTNQSVPAGSTATFTASATDADGSTPTVQWYEGSGATAVALSGQTSTTLMISNTTVDENGFTYYAVFTDPNNSNATSTTSATLTVQTAPTIQTQPTSQTAPVGGTAAFVAAATGYPTPTVQWYSDTTGLNSGGTAVSANGTNPALSVVGGTSGTYYYAVFSNTVGGTPQTATTNAVELTTVSAGVPITKWSFNSIVSPVYSNPSPTIGSGTLTPLGMANSYNNGTSNDDEDVTNSGTTSSTASGFNEDTYRIRGLASGGQNNGWSNAAPQYTQGFEIDVPVSGDNNFSVQFDWYSTTQGERDLQVQYQDPNTGIWQNVPGNSLFTASSNDFYGVSTNVNTAQGTGTPTPVFVDLSGISALAGASMLKIRAVGAYDPSLPNIVDGNLLDSSPHGQYASAAVYAVNEQQELNFFDSTGGSTAPSGTFELSYGGQTTTPITYSEGDADLGSSIGSASAIATALNALTSIKEAGGVTVINPAAGQLSGDITDDYTVIFNDPKNVPEQGITASTSGTDAVTHMAYGLDANATITVQASTNGVVQYNNTSGNWRFDNIIVNANTINNSPIVTVEPQNATYTDDVSTSVAFTAGAYSPTQSTDTINAVWYIAPAGTTTPVGGTGWSVIQTSSPTTITGGNSDSTLTLTTAQISDSMNGDLVGAVFTNSSTGSAATNPATLSVVAPETPTIATNPASGSVIAGNQFNFTAAATGGQPVASVQWLYEPAGGSSFSPFTIGTGDSVNTAGSTTVTSVLTVTGSQALTGGQFEADFYYTNPSTSSTVYSVDTTAATLNVLATQAVPLATWTFPTAPVAAPDNSPTSTTDYLGSTSGADANAGASLLPLGWGLGVTTNARNDAASFDVVATPGTAESSFTENLWRVRNAESNTTANQGWDAAAPNDTEGFATKVDTSGYSNIYMTFDWYATTQGIRDLQEEYSLDGGTTWNLLGSPLVATPNDYYGANSVSGVSHIPVVVDLTGVPAANNNPNLEIGIVAAYDPTLLNSSGQPYEYTSASLGTGGVPVAYNGTSGNWRFGNFAVDGIPDWLSPSSAFGSSWSPTTSTLTVTGAATVTADPGTNTAASPTAEPTINVTGSTAALAFDPTVGTNIHLAGLSVTGGATATVDSLPGSARSLTDVNLLVIGTSTATAAPTFTVDGTSTLDLKDNDLAILYGSGTSPLSAVQEDLQTGSNYNASTGVFQWNGTGLISSVAPTTNGATGLGYATEAELSAISENGGGSAVTTFDGESLGANAVLVKYTLMGDYDLSGTVDGGAYNVVLANYDSTADWSQGNFHYTNGTYSGGVYTPDAAGGQDYNIVLSNYDQSLASYLPGGVGGPAAVKAPPKTVATAVVSTIASTAVVTPTSAVTPSNQKPTTTETTGSSSSTGTKTTTSKSGSKKGSTKTGSTKTGTSTSGKTTTSTVKTTTLSTGSTKTGGKTTTPTTSTTATSTTGKSNKKH
jgi:hypothetical protein